ncbi:MAG: thymidine kinase [Nitratireductor sp.]|nr:thymidine kinase [Nitratireductor sp.]
MGKSTLLLQASYNYEERGMRTLLMTSSFDDRVGKGVIASRIGLTREAELFNPDLDLFEFLSAQLSAGRIDCTFVDEAQFLSEAQVWQLARVADELKIPVMCYGLRTDFQGKLFPGSKALLALADDLREIRTICWCGKKATMVVRLDGQGKIIEDGEQIVIGGEDRYVSLCRKHWSSREAGTVAKA